MDVLEHQHAGPCSASRSKKCAPGREEVLLVAATRLLEAEQVGEPRLDEAALLLVADVLLERGGSFAQCDWASSSSRIPARPRTISASAQNATPSPYARQRPECHQTSSASPSMYFSNSQARRDFPMPPIPTTETSWTFVLGGRVEQLLDEAELAVPADERRLEPVDFAAPAASRRRREPPATARRARPCP